MKKRFMSMLMAVCMVVALSGMCFATSPGSTGIQEPEVPVEDFGEEGIMPLASWCPIDNLPITSGGLWWKQDSGYSTYRVWVQNDTNEEMTVTITYDGMPAGKEIVKKVPANSSKTIVTIDNAWEDAMHHIDFQTSSGSVAGICNVRISTTALS